MCLYITYVWGTLLYGPQLAMVVWVDLWWLNPGSCPLKASVDKSKHCIPRLYSGWFPSIPWITPFLTHPIINELLLINEFSIDDILLIHWLYNHKLSIDCPKYTTIMFGHGLSVDSLKNWGDYPLRWSMN